jgi:hypothetical protein
MGCLTATGVLGLVIEGVDLGTGAFDLITEVVVLGTLYGGGG